MKENFAEQLKDLNNYKGKEVVVHAYRTHLNAGMLENQYFAYRGVIDEKIINKISYNHPYFILDCNGVDLICKFYESTGLYHHECTVVSIDDAKTGEQILKNIYVRDEPTNEIIGAGLISGVKGNKRLENLVGDPAVLLETHVTKDGQKYMRLLLKNGSACYSNIPNNFKLKEVESKNAEMEM